MNERRTILMKNEINEQHDSPRLGRHLSLLIIAAAIAMGMIAFTNEWIVVEKVITALVMPVGLIWLGLLLVTYFAAIYSNRYLFFVSLIVWTAFGLVSNEVVARRLMSSLEESYLSTDPLGGDAYDYVVVLGGGASYPMSGRAQLWQSGDRIAVAAQMYHAKKAEKIIATGTAIKSFQAENIPSYGEITRTLLERFNVPASAIETSPGRNTSEEFATLAKRFAGREPGSRVGLITSAWHLPRAMRLAKKNGLEVDPIPADIRTGQQKLTILSFIPSDDALNNSTLALKEYLARIAGR